MDETWRTLAFTVNDGKMTGNPHFTCKSSLLKLKPGNECVFGWTSAGLPSGLTAQCDFTVSFLRFLRELFPRPVVLARPSVFPQALSHYDLSLLTVPFGKHYAFPHLWKAEPWGHPGRLPCTSQIMNTSTHKCPLHLNIHTIEHTQLCKLLFNSSYSFLHKYLFSSILTQWFRHYLILYLLIVWFSHRQTEISSSMFHSHCRHFTHLSASVNLGRTQCASK